MFSLHKTLGGVHPPQCKDTRDCPCTWIEPPSKVRIPLNMHIGAPCTPCVEVGDHVYIGTLIGTGEGLYAPIYASVSGTVTSVATEKLPTGATAPVVEITSDGKMENDPALEVPTYTTKDEFIACVRNSGVVGLGGASFPTWFKMQAPAGKKFEFVVVNAMECEPYITSDYRQMIEHAERVIDGVVRISRALEIPAVVIGVVSCFLWSDKVLGEPFGIPANFIGIGMNCLVLFFVHQKMKGHKPEGPFLPDLN